MKKPLTQLVPDLREALEKGLEEAAEQVVMDLKKDGPYWTGFFESLWEVNPGNTAVKANIKNPLKVPKQPKTRQITPVEIPESPNLDGYTIGNRSDYRLYAMDIEPSPSGRGAYPAANLTADKNWFDRYVNAKMPQVVNQTLINVFRRY